MWGRAFVVKTDHYSLKFLLDQRMATIPQHQWVSTLTGFNFLVEYKPGTSNTVVDALSRHEEVVAGELAVLSAPQFKMFDDLCTNTEEVAELRKLRDEIIAGDWGDEW
jgi:hypothetical protein